MSDKDWTEAGFIKKNGQWLRPSRNTKDITGTNHTTRHDILEKLAGIMKGKI